MNAEKARQIEENRLRALEKLQSNRQSAAIIASKNAQLPQLTAQIVPNPPLKQSVVPPAPQRRPTASFDLRLDSLTHFSIHPWHEALLGPGSEFRLKFPQSDRYMKQSVCLPIALYAEVLQFFQCGDLRKKWQITLTTPPRSVFDYLNRHYREVPYREGKCMTGIQAAIEPFLYDSLLPYQRECVSYVINRCNGRALIADDMGLGKTVQAIAIASYYRSEWPALIVCPSSVRLTWCEALHHWLPSLRKSEVNVVYECKDSLAGSAITIISYDIAVKKHEELRRKNYQIIIARTKALLPILQSAKRCILLSGTPALSRPAELYSQIMAIVPRLFQHFKDFGVRYCAGHLNHFGWDFKGASNLEELQTVMSIFMIRRRKAEVLAHLPPKSREHLMLAVSATSHTTTRPRLKVGIVEDEDAQPVDSSTLSFWRETSAIKMPAVVAYIRQLVASKGEPFLLFAHHREMLDALDELLYQLRVDFIRIDGQVDSALRQQHCNRFQTDPFCRVALLSVTAAGVGLTLTRASLVVFAELYWNPGLLMQAEDRVHRIGQTQPVTIRYLLAKNTIDDVIWPLLIKKLNVLERIGLSKSELELLPGQTSSKRVDYSGGAASGGRRQASITSYLVPAANQSSNSADTEDFESAFDYIDENELEALMADFPC